MSREVLQVNGKEHKKYLPNSFLSSEIIHWFLFIWFCFWREELPGCLGSDYISPRITIIISFWKNYLNSVSNFKTFKLSQYKEERMFWSKTEHISVQEGWNEMHWYHSFCPCFICQWNQLSITKHFNRTKYWHSLQYSLRSFDAHHAITDVEELWSQP